MELDRDQGSRSDCNKSFSTDEMNNLLVFWMTPSVLSSVICIIALLMVISLKLYKYFVYRLALYQVLACLFFSIVGIVQLINVNYTKDEFNVVTCKITAFLLQYSMWVKLLFTLCLVFHMFCLAVCLKNLEKLEYVYILLSVLFPLLHAWIPFIHNSYSVTNAWCWIRGWKDNCPNERYKEGIIEQFTLWYGPLMLSLTVCLFATGVIVSVLAWRAYNRYKSHDHHSENDPLILNQQQQSQNKKALKQLLPLLVYPIFFYLLALLPFIDRVYEALSHDNYYLVILHAVSNASWGFFSGLALIVHMLLLRKPLCRKDHRKDAIKTNNTAEAVTAVYTVYTDASTGAKTMATMSRESDVDFD